jgi:peptidoglycan/xylan/chitin deacetylase (PgdA/CDA1 family)
MIIKNISRWGRVFYPSLLWKVIPPEKTIYLTFDDGPIPEVTPWVLSLLKKFNAKATFFCIGDNINKNPDIFNMIVSEGHSIGNHTFNHLNGWKTSAKNYIENIALAEEILYKDTPVKATQKLFRPPYGRITPGQIKTLQKKNYQIVMWDVISCDYNTNISGEECFNNVVEQAGSGSIVVFHDSLKASENLKMVLPEVLTYYQERGYVFKALTRIP